MADSNSTLPSIAGFDIQKLIARGGMAEVYLATQKALGRRVALKVMDAHKDESFAERFLNEGRLIASLSHPNVITIHDLGRLDDGRVYISMEYIDGGDLEQRMRTSIGADDALKILRTLAECLQYVHEHEVVHRDIKPANILFRQNGSLVLTDFGIAKQQSNDVKLTREGDIVGSPGYMSPEQAQAHHVDHRSDIYSVGVIFAEILMGKNSFEADSYIQTSMNHIQMAIPVLDSNLSAYQPLLERMLAKHPHERYNNAKSLIRAIDALEQDGDAEPVSVSDISMPKKGLFSGNDTLITVIFLLAFLGGGGYFFQQAMVKSNLEKASSAYASDRLMLPESNNAYYYYQQVLTYSPGNERAQQGLMQLADRYETLAKSALKRGRKTKARSYTERGLKAQPDHVGLLAVEKKLR